MSDIDLFNDDPTSNDNDAPQLQFPSTDAFVEHLAKLYRRDVTGSPKEFRWCHKWWNHAEAHSRLEALWRTWEHLRLDPATGMSNWWKEADRTMSHLLSPSGPFALCRDEHRAMPPLPCDPAPAGLFSNELYGR